MNALEIATLTTAPTTVVDSASRLSGTVGKVGGKIFPFARTGWKHCPTIERRCFTLTSPRPEQSIPEKGRGL